MKKTLSLSLFTFLFYWMASASPINPVPLRELIMESRYIIEGRVCASGKGQPEKQEDKWKTDYVVIRIKKVLQGELHVDTIRIYYFGAVICPAPPHFEKDCDALLFLNTHDPQKKEFYVMGMSYGTKNFPDPAKLAVYKQRIAEMQAILRMPDKQRQQEATIDWLVTCAIHPYTYQEGLYELRAREYYLAGDIRYIPDSIRNIDLNYDCRKRIFDALSRRDTLRTVDMDLVDMAMGVNDGQLLEEVKKGLNCIDTAGNGGNLIFTDMMMRRVVEMTDDAMLRRLMERFRNSVFGRGTTRPDKRLFAEFREQMQHTPLKKTPAKGPERTV